MPSPVPLHEFWHRDAAANLAALGVTDKGLTADAATERHARFGGNGLLTTAQRPVWLDLVRRLANPLVLILLAASGAAAVTGDLVSFSIIVTIVALSTVLDTVQERRAAATAAALKRSIALTARVLRDGVWAEHPVDDLVPGDMVSLSAGDLVPADGVVVTANAVQVNQAALTGESFPVEKNPAAAAGTGMADAANLLLSGSSVIGGTATMLVVETGAHTRFGAIASSLGGNPETTAFEVGIRKFGVVIARLTVFLVLFVLLARLALGRPALESFLFAMALAVGLTPELLPMIMTITLARGAKRMAAAKVVVKRLSSIHDLGQMDVLCTDKTGTLTQAQIAMVGHPGIDGTDRDRVYQLAVINAAFAQGMKSPLDQALLAHDAPGVPAGWTRLDERPFDFERRRVSVLAAHGDTRVIIVKGAPEAVLALCTQVEQADGKVVPIDAAITAQAAALVAARAAEGLRMLAIAWKAADGLTRIDGADDHALILAGYCVFIDPPKPSARAALTRLAHAGVRVKLVTGDAVAVAQHLAGEVGLAHDHVLTGDQITHMSATALIYHVNRTDLFARVSPDQKLRIVHALRARGHTVGFIGDGINDAPAIRVADVGLSVDGATDVAREAADMILLAPDLAVLADGIIEGRRTYANIMKYLRMGTSSNFGNMLSMAVASLFLPFLPLTAAQVLLNNLLYDISQTGIPFDNADPPLLQRPHGWDMRALVRFTAIMGPLSSVFDLATFGLLLWVFHADIPTFRAAWFVESMATQVLVVLVIRTSGPAWRLRPDRVLLATLLGSLGVALALPFLPFARMLGFAPLGPGLSAAIVGLVVTYLALAEWLKRWALPRAERTRP
ncbi:magnesium-translocating P-type ATPase [Novosphingobium sp.]|uniref:magnesium-translocating P-type ATPase n=1 Tax=Novosphingobium sp. TaxID=1874826 RepID=UPI0033412CF5